VDAGAGVDAGVDEELDDSVELLGVDAVPFESLPASVPDFLA
jgi:hypothetical protein